MSEALNEIRSARMVAALEAAWDAIRAQHPDVPAVVMTLGSGTMGAARGVRLGHFAAARWGTGESVTAELAEVFVGGEGLRRGAVDVLATLLHEAAHALAHVREIKDTSRQGRYHNRRYKALAEELGITVRESAGIGWSDTSVPRATVETYQDVVDELVQALVAWRRSEGQIGTAAKTGDSEAGDEEGEETTPKPGAYTCACDKPRRIRVAPSVFALGPILCSLCAEPFTPAL